MNYTKTNKQLIKDLQRQKTLKTKVIVKAFQKIDRADFVSKEYTSEAYNDYALLIGYGATISQPTTVAFMLELLQPSPGDKVLDIGSGSGWTTALLAELVGQSGEVIGLELVLELVKLGQANLAKYTLPQAHIELSTRGKLGLPGQEFDRILVSAAADSYTQELVEQIKPGGRLVMPILETLYEIKKGADGSITEEQYPGFVFVPLLK